MLRKFKSSLNLFSGKVSGPFLLAVSGGIDSVVMANLFKRTDLPFGIAHCNFSLRGNEADEDENLARKISGKFKVPFFSVKFDTADFARANSLSLQVAARDLRYSWLEKIRSENNYGFICTAHHSDDSIETFFINLLRGTGIDGLAGIPVLQGNIFRPLLNFSRGEIFSYAGEEGLDYRTDSSNAEDYYLRNRIRHHLIPAFEEIAPSFKNVMMKNISNLKEASGVLNEMVNEAFEKCIVIKKERTEIGIDSLLGFSNPQFLLYSFLKRSGFNSVVSNSVFRAVKDLHPGKCFYSASHEAVIDRRSIFVQPIGEDEEIEMLVSEEGANEPFRVSIEVVSGAVVVRPGENVLQASMESVRFPLKIRRWKEGDRFIPFGMKSEKKLSDFFIDEKVPLSEKKKKWVLESGGAIIWIIGMRASELVRVREGNCFYRITAGE